MSTSDRPVFNDRYEIHSRIGRGGMADVFLARDRLLDVSHVGPPAEDDAKTPTPSSSGLRIATLVLSHRGA
jgi:serine/threonine protein kinase